jgi:hypothetical protein
VRQKGLNRNLGQGVVGHVELLQLTAAIMHAFHEHAEVLIVNPVITEAQVHNLGTLAQGLLYRRASGLFVSKQNRQLSHASFTPQDLRAWPLAQKETMKN